MHELAIAQALIGLAEEHAARAGATRVTRLNCRIGALRQIEDELMRDAFEIARVGTACASADLKIEKTPLRAACASCEREFSVQNWRWNCPICGAEGAPIAGGDELELLSIEAETRP